jgi:hypothetical protein
VPSEANSVFLFLSGALILNNAAGAYTNVGTNAVLRLESSGASFIYAVPIFVSSSVEGPSGAFDGTGSPIYPASPRSILFSYDQTAFWASEFVPTGVYPFGGGQNLMVRGYNYSADPTPGNLGDFTGGNSANTLMVSVAYSVLNLTTGLFI